MRQDQEKSLSGWNHSQLDLVEHLLQLHLQVLSKAIENVSVCKLTYDESIQFITEMAMDEERDQFRADWVLFAEDTRG